MDKKKLIELFNKEKQRVLENVFNPIIDVLNNQKYDIFFNYYLITNMNMEIVAQKLSIPSISFSDFSDFYEKKSRPEYIKVYEAVINKILDSYNFEIFKLVFGDDEFKNWAICFFKFIIYSYFETQGLTDISSQIATNTFNVAKLMNYADNFETFNNIIYKHIYGYSQTSIHSLEYWRRVTGISRKQYYRFFETVNTNNPGIYLVNSFLYYFSDRKLSHYKTHPIHNYKEFKPQPRIDMKDKSQAYEWSVNYFAVLTLNSKLQIGIWKAIQNLTFGTRVGLNVIALRTMTEINVNLKNIWMLNDKDKLFFRNIKYQALWNVNLPKTFDEYLAQDAAKIEEMINPLIVKFVTLRKKLLFNQEIEQQEKIKSDKEIIEKLQTVETEIKK